MRVPYTKLEGLGNDWIVVSAGDLEAAQSGGRSDERLYAGLARAVCGRKSGVGADGLIIALPPRNANNHACLRFFNADGSEAEMSGNGIRCAAALLCQAVRLRRRLRIETAAGVRVVRWLKSAGKTWMFQVGMGWPIIEPDRIPFNAGGAQPPIVDFPLSTSRGELPVTVTSMGNPHCTLLVEDFDAINWQALGREIECNPLFPRRTNVEFVKVASRHRISARFWERGVGETQSSGTGSCAAVVACVLNARTARRVSVRTPGGVVQVDWPPSGEILLTGPVALVKQGTYRYRESV